MTRKREAQLGLSAVVFLVLCVWMGPHAACWLVAIAAIVAMWVAACRRWPFAARLSIAFLDGFLSGLIGSRRRYRRW